MKSLLSKINRWVDWVAVLAILLIALSATLLSSLAESLGVVIPDTVRYLIIFAAAFYVGALRKRKELSERADEKSEG